MATIRKRYWLTGVVVLALAAVAMWWLRPTPISGPWRAQLVDAETGQPLEGAVVLALWDKRTFGWPHPDRNYHDVDEVVSDADGRFIIPARDVSSRHPFEKIIGPIVTIFKPGYGQWWFQGTPAPFAEDAVAARQRSEANWAQFAQHGAVIVMPRAKTRDERLHVLDRMLPAMEVPRTKIPKTLAAYSHERVTLGLRPRR
ncbi:MAG: hypothetical protein DMD78_13780 [Candidatus Rokuibacteriota bacterium]|nr:MAG: hypothetical protein DMD78_13780 [Candidatus Rokubacteria bacterium]